MIANDRLLLPRDTLEKLVPGGTRGQRLAILAVSGRSGSPMPVSILAALLAAAARTRPPRMGTTWELVSTNDKPVELYTWSAQHQRTVRLP